eukprot:GEMP01015801.1.p1 GENE.GEMP01015801.1~~GEMP01015801.1.p1  ORF type:complete len:350 (-),score=52.59 GEMP01015801.1:1744-2793(-)
MIHTMGMEIYRSIIRDGYTKVVDNSTLWRASLMLSLYSCFSLRARMNALVSRARGLLPKRSIALFRTVYNSRYRDVIMEWYRSFFAGHPGNISALEEDPMLQFIRDNPEEAIWFIKAVMLFGAVSAILVAAPCFLFLLLRWQPCGGCNRPLRYWVLFHCLLLLCQTPVRIVFVVRLMRSRREHVQEEVKSLVTSPAWWVSKVISVITYGWFILGVVWLINSTYCPVCPALYRLTVSVVCMSLSRLAVTMVCFYQSFPPPLRHLFQPPSPTRPAGATRSQICHIKVGRVVHHSSQIGETCAICIEDFKISEIVRYLPCSHSFHQGCIDKWLMRQSVCPLCLRDISQKKNA